MGQPYKPGELETVLSTVPTQQNIDHLSQLLGRKPGDVELIYRVAFERGKLKASKAMQRKILAAKQTLGIRIGWQTLQDEEH